MPKKKTAVSPAPAAPTQTASQLAAGVEITGEANPGDPGTPGAPLAAGSTPPVVTTAPKQLPFGNLPGIAIFGERERTRLVSIATEIGSLKKRSAELLARVNGEVYRLLETIGEAAGGTCTDELTADILGQVEAMPGEDFPAKLAAFAVKGRASLKMAAAQAEFDNMRSLAGIEAAPDWTNQPRFGGEGSPLEMGRDGDGAGGRFDEPPALTPDHIPAPKDGEGLQPVGDDVLPD